jgi:hypothetical protein
MEFEVTGDADAWPLVGAALLSRATSTLFTFFDAGRGGQAVDAATLGRSLYEYVVHLAWLAADPCAARIQAWRKVDLIARLKADTDAQIIGEPLCDDQARAGVEPQGAGMEGPDRPPNLADLAVAADKHWAGKPGAWERTRSATPSAACTRSCIATTARPRIPASWGSTTSSRTSQPPAGV